jgi:hypothetical protein
VQNMRFESREGQENFSLLQNVQTGSWAHPTSYLMGTGVLSGWARVVKQPGREIDHSPPPST